MQVRKKLLTLAVSLFSCEAGRREQVVGGAWGGRMAFRSFLPSNGERSVSQTHSELVPVWNVGPHIHVSMAATVGQSVGG